jgi:hypothetical protein
MNTRAHNNIIKHYSDWIHGKTSIVSISNKTKHTVSTVSKVLAEELKKRYLERYYRERNSPEDTFRNDWENRMLGEGVNYKQDRLEVIKGKLNVIIKSSV